MDIIIKDSLWNITFLNLPNEFMSHRSPFRVEFKDLYMMSKRRKKFFAT